VNNEKVSEQYKPHQLVGEWKPHMECHIQSDFLLIWDTDDEANELILVRCGSHSELFG
jgi:mRNA interferase YafQ